MSKVVDRLKRAANALDGTSYPGVELEAIAEIDRLEAIVAKLPKTADGVGVLPGFELYHPSELNTVSRCGKGHVRYEDWEDADDEGVEFGDSNAPRSLRWYRISECYSTREAALAARTESEDKRE